MVQEIIGCPSIAVGAELYERVPVTNPRATASIGHMVDAPR